jgi:AcrR family transcriptional regulator
MTRKERERREREALILREGRQLLYRNGFQNLNLDSLADAVEYSKGTLYQHFASKEDLVLAIATQALRERADWFERVARFEGKTRERARAIGIACCHFMLTYPDYFDVDMMLTAHSFWEKVSPERQQEHALQGGRCFRTLHGIVTEAHHVGDLPSRGTSLEHVTFSLIAITMGSHAMAQKPTLRLLAGLHDPAATIRLNQVVILDGWGWKPLEAEFDYRQTDLRIRKELFPEATWLGSASE